MSTYLPKDSTGGSAYQDGGGLYALGLIHANHGANITEYLLNQLKEATSEVCWGAMWGGGGANHRVLVWSSVQPSMPTMGLTSLNIYSTS